MEENKAAGPSARPSGILQFVGVALAMGALGAVAALSNHGAPALEPLSGGYEPPIEARLAAAPPDEALARGPTSAKSATLPALR